MNVIDAPDAPFRLTAPVEHITTLDDGTLLLHVTVTSESPDDQGEIVDYDAFKEAAPELMKWATLGEVHDDGRMDAGTILRLYLDDDARRAEADVHVVDPVAIKKVLTRVYKMVSLGGQRLQTRLEQRGGRTLRRITKLRAGELSLVPRGSNPDSMIRKQWVLAKASALPDPDDGRTPEQRAYDETVARLAKEAADPAVGGGRVRSSLPKSDFVFPEDAPDGGFPIASAGDVADAVSSWGRYKGPHSFDDFKRRLTSIANRKGYPLPKAWAKEERKMAKAARKSAATAEPQTEVLAKAADAPDAPDAPDDGDGKAAPPAPPFKGKGKGKAAKKARKMAKSSAFAKGKNKTIKYLAEALEAVTCAISEEADEGESPTVKALTAVADGIHAQMMVEAAEVHPDDDDDDEMEPVEGPSDEVDGEGDEAEDDFGKAAVAYAKRRRKDAAAAPRLRKRLAKSSRKVKRLRKQTRSLRKERRSLRKASLFTSVLAKSGARHSAADMAKIDAIHEQTVALGTSAHKLADAVAGEPSTTSVESDTIAKAGTTTEPTPSVAEQIAAALAGVVPSDRLEHLSQQIVAANEKLAAQGETLAKIAAQPMSSGPFTAVLRGPATDGAEVGSRGELLAKAATMIDDPRLRSDVSQAAALEMIQRQRNG